MKSANDVQGKRYGGPASAAVAICVFATFTAIVCICTLGGLIMSLRDVPEPREDAPSF